MLLNQASALFASEIMQSADTLESKSWSLAVYGKTVESEPEVRVTDTQAVQVPVSGGGSATLFSSANTEFELEQEYSAVLAVIAVRPGDGLTYRAKLGQIQDFEVQVPSGSATNTLESENDGFIWGVGVGWNLAQGTIVSAAVALDLSYTQTLVDLDRFHSAGGTAAIDDRYKQDEFQAALNVSRRWKMLEPFAGLKLSRTVTRLRDRTTKESVSGTVDGISPFVGLKWNVFEGESVVVEGSFVDEKSVSAGMNVRF